LEVVKVGGNGELTLAITEWSRVDSCALSQPKHYYPKRKFLTIEMTSHFRSRKWQRRFESFSLFSPRSLLGNKKRALMA
jgi:hypothetical protein